MKNFEAMRTGFLKEINARRTELSAKVSEYDSILQDALHFLESEKCDAIAMVQVAKKIKETRKVRRKAKIELVKLQSVRDSMTKGVVRFDKKTYTYRTTAMSTIKRTHKKEEEIGLSKY